MKRKFLWALPGIFALSMLLTILVVDADPLLNQAEQVLVTDLIQIVKSALQNQPEPVKVTDAISIVKAALQNSAEPILITDDVSFVKSVELTISEPIAVHDVMPDVTPPTVTLTAKPSNPTASAQTAFSWTITDPDNSSGFQSFCQIDGASATACTSGVSYPSLSDGTHSFTVSAADAAGNRSAPATWTWRVDTMPPVISCPTPDSSWHGSNQSFTCTATDSGTGLAKPADASFTLSTSVPTGAETATASTGTHQVCDVVGNCTTAGPLTGIKVDMKAPVLAAVAITTGDGKPYSGGTWTNQSVQVTFTCADGGSGVNIASVTALVTISTEGNNQSVPGSCTDNVGNTAGTSFTNIDIDKTPPIITFVGQSPAANASGWNNTSVTLTWTCADSLSGAVSPAVSKTITTEGANQSASGTCTDLAGNAASNAKSGVNIDETAPVFTASATTADGKPYTGGTWTSQNVTVTFACTDALSGVASTTGPTTFSSEGTNQSVTGTCTDKAGNAAPPVTFAGIDIDRTPPSTGFTAQPGPLNGRQLATATVNTSINPGAISISTTCYDSFGLNAVLSATDNLSAVASIKWGQAPIVFGQPLPNPALTNTINGASGTIPFTTSGMFVLNYAAVDAAGNQEATHTRWIFVSTLLGISCATTPVPFASLPPAGTVTVSGALQVGTIHIPFAFGFTYPSKQK